MKIRKAGINLYLWTFLILLFTGCDVVDDPYYEYDLPDSPASPTLPAVEANNCDSQTYKILESTFVVFGGAALTEMEINENGLQTFYLTTEDSDCDPEKKSGMLVQSSKTVNNVSFTLNGAKISIGSTVYFSINQGNSLSVQTLEGSARVTVEEKTATGVGGTQVVVPLNETSQASGKAPEIQASEMFEDEFLPVDELEYEFEYSDPLDDEELAYYDEYEMLFNGIDIEDVDEFFEYLSEEDGEDIPEYLIEELGYSDFVDDVEEFLQDDLGYDLEEYDGYTGDEFYEEGAEAGDEFVDEEWVEGEDD